MAGIATIQNAKWRVRLVPPVDTRVQHAIARIAETDCAVLILGEHGAGKRSWAAQIHAQSHLSRNAFQEISCAETSASALMAALASGGTVYLNEITELSLDLQELILHAHFLSGREPGCRLLCGSSRELLEEVKAWRMREDFYYLVSAVTLRIPPLRCRKSEILSIADELLAQYARQFDRPKPVLCQELTGYLMEHAWPGNISELQTAMKTVAAIEDQAIALAAIKAAQAGRANGTHRPHLLKEATRASSNQIERALISEVLIATGGNRKRAAADLGISYKALLNKLKQIEMKNQSVSDKNGVTL